MAQTHVITPENVTTARRFDCDQDLDDEFDYTLVNVSDPDSIGNRYDLEDYEDSCIEVSRFIVPSLLKNIYNQLTPLLNSVTFVQKIQIKECRWVGNWKFLVENLILNSRNRREPCNEDSYPPVNYRYICNQDYLIIQLQAVKNGGTIYQDEFYIPSSCSCRLVRVAKKLKKLAKKPEIVYVWSEFLSWNCQEFLKNKKFVKQIVLSCLIIRISLSVHIVHLTRSLRSSVLNLSKSFS